MKLPEFIRIGYLTIRVREMDDEEACLRGVNGWWNYENATIEVAASLAPAVKAEIFLHEVLHACCTLSNVDIGDEKEESAVNGIAPRLLQFLGEHPKIVAAMASQVERGYRELA